MERVVIGDATLYLADSREILPTLGPVDFIFTDPPYGNSNQVGDLAAARHTRAGTAARAILNDGDEAHDLAKWLFATANEVLPAGGAICCCCSGGGGRKPTMALWSIWMDERIPLKQIVIWDKGPMGLGWHYRRSYEVVLVGQRKGTARWFDSSHRVENIIRPSMGIKKRIPTSADHPTPKPPELAAHFIRLHTEAGHTVLDPFMGAGSTAVAALREGRKFIGIELDRRWFDLAVQRVEKEMSAQ